MADPDHWIHSICRFLTSCRRTWGDVTGPSQRLGDNFPQVEPPGTSFVERLHGGADMPERCRLFLGCVNILTVALVVGLAMGDVCPDDNQQQQRLHLVGFEYGGNDIEQDEDSRNIIQFEQRTEKESLASITEEPETSERGETGEVIGAGCLDCRAVCTDCSAIAKKTIRLLSECGYCGGEEHTVRPTDCKICGGIEHTNEAIYNYRVDFPSDSETSYRSGGNRTRNEAVQGESEEPRIDYLEGGDLDHPTGSQVYWRKRVLDILAPSLPPLPNVFDDLGTMNEIGNHTSPDLAEGHNGDRNEGATGQGLDGGSLEHESAHDRSHRLQDGPQHEPAPPPSTTSQADPEIRDNRAAAIQRARTRARELRMHRLNSSSRVRQNPSPTPVQTFSSATAPRSDYNSGYLGSSMVPARLASPPPHGNDPHRTIPLAMPPPGGYVFPYNQTPGSRFNPGAARPLFGNAPLPDYYSNNQVPNSTGQDFSGADSHSRRGNDPPQPSSSDDEDLRSLSSNSPSSGSYRPLLSHPVDHPRLHPYALARARSRPRGRVLSRRPRCGLMMVKALREDPSCVPEEGETHRQPGQEDKLFSPKRGDVILRHMILPGRGVVEVYFPGLEEDLQDGDSLVRLKMDNVSYPTMLIVRAKAYLFLQGKWIYLGRHQHGVRKPKKERILG